MYDKIYPWLTRGAVEFLMEYIPGKTVLEFGMGISTLWFAQRAEQIVSIEHNEDWYDKTRIATKGFLNCTLIYAPLPYHNVCNQFTEKFDFILVDGRGRVKCFKKALKVLKPGGVIMLDNSERKSYKECLKTGKFIHTYGPDYTGNFNYPDWRTSWTFVH